MIGARVYAQEYAKPQPTPIVAFVSVGLGREAADLRAFTSAVLTADALALGVGAGAGPGGGPERSGCYRDLTFRCDQFRDLRD